MAVINFEPTWISVFIDGERVRTSEPIEVASRSLGNDPYDAATAIGFDAQKILDFINHSETPAYVHLTYDEIDYISTGVYINRFEGDETEIQNQYVGTYTGLRLPQFGPRQVTLNELTVNGEDITFKQAIESGYTGLGFRKSGTVVSGIGLYENATFLLEGEWVINAPSNLAPSGGILQNVDEPIVFSWNHNGSFEQKTFELRYRLVGDSEWNTVTEETGNQSYTLSPGALGLGEYEWQVRTTTDYDYESPWSSLSVFQVAETTPTPTITYPESGGTVPISDLHVEWESEEQYEFELELFRVIGETQSTELIRSVSRTSTSTEHTFEDVLDNNETYIVRLRVNQEGGIWSSWATAFFNVEYTEPAQPELVFVTDNDKSTITVYIENPTPTGTQPNVLSQDLYRVEPNGETIRIAKDLNPNDFFVDFTPASNKQYEYYVRLFGDNEVNVNSNRFSASVKVRHVLINLTTNLSEMLELRLDPVKSFDTSFSAVTRTFAGRAKPVVEFGETIEQTGSISYTVDHDTLVKLYDFLYQQETLLYRDSRGRKQFVAVSNISVSDELRHLDLYSVSLSLTEVDYNEAIE